jgi:hypothetical protein
VAVQLTLETAIEELMISRVIEGAPALVSKNEVLELVRSHDLHDKELAIRLRNEPQGFGGEYHINQQEMRAIIAALRGKKP